MNIGELLRSRHEGVVIDRPRHTLIQVSQPVRQARTAWSIIGAILAMMAGLVAGWAFEGWAVFVAAFVAGAGVYLLLHRTSAARTRYTSWTYPESYNLFDDELIRDRFATHRDEFTLIPD